jgi:hypothetical protein
MLNIYLSFTQNIVKEIKQCQEKWLQHVQRMDTNRIPKQALQYKPKGRRNIGRPKKRWRDQFHFEDQGTEKRLILHEHDNDDDDDDDLSFNIQLKYFKISPHKNLFITIKLFINNFACIWNVSVEAYCSKISNVRVT